MLIKDRLKIVFFPAARYIFLVGKAMCLWWKLNDWGSALAETDRQIERQTVKKRLRLFSRKIAIFLERDMAQWLERRALSMSLPAVRSRIPLGAGLSEKYHVPPLSVLGNCFDVVSLGETLNPQMLYLTQVKISTWWGRDGNEYNAPKWLQDCMLTVGLRWHTNDEQVQ